MKDHITPNLLKLARLFKKKGELYIVGGYVRNALLGIYETDIDLASKLTNEEIKELLFGTKYEVKETSKKLGTLVISLGEEKWEHTTFRKEKYAEGGDHSPISVEFIDDIREDAKRRDFTANAIYYNILKDEYIDFYTGIKDVKRGVLRTVETPDVVLGSDGIRILRMIRLASELSFKISGETLLTAYKMKENLSDISGERKYKELMLILKSPTRYKISKPFSFMFGLQMFNLLRLWKYYNSPVLKVHFKQVQKASPGNRFIAVIIDIISSSRKLLKNNKEELVNQLLGKQGLCLPENKIESIKHILCGYFDALDKVENKKYFIEYFDDFKIIREFLYRKSKKIYSKYNFFYNYLINNKIPIRIKDLKISGKDIKEKFPKIKEKYYKTILADLLDRVFDSVLKNDKKTLIEEVEKVKI
jgi:tRNA nucleotidyltransferase/poly(A) polymerase